MSFFWLDGYIKNLLAASKGERADRSFFTNVYLCILGLSLLFGLAILAFKAQTIPFLTARGDLPYVELYIFYLILQTPATLHPYFLLTKEKSRGILLVTILHSLGFLLAVLLPLLIQDKLELIFQSLFLVGVLNHVVLLIYLIRAKCSFPGMKKMLLFLSTGLPLALYSFFAGCAPFFDAWLINFEFGNDETFALWRYGARELPLVAALAGALSLGAIALVATQVKQGIAALKKHTTQLMHWVFPISILLICVSTLLFDTLFGPEYKASARIFNIFLLLVLSQVLFPQSILIALKERKLLLKVSLLELAINVLLSVFLLDKIGIEGVAFATVIAFYLEKVILIVWLKSKYSIKLRSYLPIGLFSFYSFLVLIAFLIRYLEVF